jgi:hypothetical protein
LDSDSGRGRDEQREVDLAGQSLREDDHGGGELEEGGHPQQAVRGGG